MGYAKQISMKMVNLAGQIDAKTLHQTPRDEIPPVDQNKEYEFERQRNDYLSTCRFN